MRKRATGEKLTQTPSRDHIEVEESGERAEECATRLQSFDPAVEREHEQEDSDSFVVIRASDRTRDVTGSNSNESSREKAGALIFHLLRKPDMSVSLHTWTMNLGTSHVSRPSRQRTETRSKKDTDVPDVNREVKGMKNIVDDAASRHQARIDGTSHNATKGIPGGRVKPVPEFLNTRY